MEDYQLPNEDTGIEPTTPIQPLFCRDCHWVSIPHSYEVERYKCFCPENYVGVHLVDNSKVYYYPLCIDQRNVANRNPVACSVQAKWFKRKELPSIVDVTIGGKIGVNLELVVVKPKPIVIKRLSNEDLENI